MRLINADKIHPDVRTQRGALAISQGQLAYAETVNAILIPKGATNGEIIQALFPNIDKAFSNVLDLNLWWNAKYKAESEDKCKNCEYYHNPDYTRCHKCKAESEDKG